jgi:glycosyltransferase involved in cell wall biosynthesis
MRICHVITRLIVGGAQENTLLTCRGLVRAGHEVTLVAGPETGPEGSLWSWAESGCGRVIRLDPLRRNVHPWHDLRALQQLTRRLREVRCDVVHTHSSKAGILGRQAARWANVPVIVHTIHGMSFNRTQPAAVRWLYRQLERWAADRTDAFVTVADAMTNQAVAAGLADRARFRTIYSGMQTECFRPDPAARRQMRSQWNVPPECVVVGTVARLFRNKGYEELLAALPEVIRRAPNVRFVWVGDGPSRREYEAVLHRAGLREFVHFVGLVQPDAMPALLNGVDLLVHTSRWEGLPRAAVQALLTEVPVIASDIDGAPEVVIPGVTGELVPLGDVNALVEKLAHLVGCKTLRERYGREGRARCLERFDHRRMVDQLQALYARLLAQKQGSPPESVE